MPTITKEALRIGRPERSEPITKNDIETIRRWNMKFKFALKF